MRTWQAAGLYRRVLTCNRRLQQQAAAEAQQQRRVLPVDAHGQEAPWRDLQAGTHCAAKILRGTHQPAYQNCHYYFCICFSDSLLPRIRQALRSFARWAHEACTSSSHRLYSSVQGDCTSSFFQAQSSAPQVSGTTRPPI